MTIRHTLPRIGLRNFRVTGDVSRLVMERVVLYLGKARIILIIFVAQMERIHHTKPGSTVLWRRRTQTSSGRRSLHSAPGFYAQYLGMYYCSMNQAALTVEEPP